MSLFGYAMVTMLSRKLMDGATRKAEVEEILLTFEAVPESLSSVVFLGCSGKCRVYRFI
jgi:hypothetical protein